MYGLHTINDRRQLWLEIKQLGFIRQPWLLMGNFTTVFAYDHRINGNPVTQQEIYDGNQCIQRVGLNFLKSIGQFYSWTKRGSSDD